MISAKISKGRYLHRVVQLRDDTAMKDITKLNGVNRATDEPVQSKGTRGERHILRIGSNLWSTLGAWWTTSFREEEGSVTSNSLISPNWAMNSLPREW